MQLFEFATKVRDIAISKNREFILVTLITRQAIDSSGREVTDRIYHAEITGDALTGSDLTILEELEKVSCLKK